MNAPRIRVLLAEDDIILARSLTQALRTSGLDVGVAHDGATALAVQSAQPADVVLLDLGLPDVDGLQVLAQLRARDDVPVIVLTGRAGEGERVAGLDLGADDYVIKPAYPSELAARVRAVVRRRTSASTTAPTDPSPMEGLSVDVEARTLHVDGREVEVPPREFDLLAHLVARRGRACSREELLREVWHSSPAYQDPATVTEHVARLRGRLGNGPGRPRIATVRGVGYRLTT